jgi:hypothetical protein
VVRVVEPLAHLMAGVRRVLCEARAGQAPAGGNSAGASGGGDASAAAQLRRHFAYVRRRLTDETLEDFQIDASIKGWSGAGVEACRGGSQAAGRDLPVPPPPHHPLDSHIPCPLPAADDAGTSPAGQESQARADALLGCYEVAMEDVIEQLTGGWSRGKLRGRRTGRAA